MIAGLRIVAAHEHEVLDAERGRTEQVGLQRDAVAVASGDLDDRIEAGLAHDHRSRQRGHRDDRAVAVGDVDRVDGIAQRVRPAAHDGSRGGLWWIELGRDDELASTQKLAERAYRSTASLIFP